METISKRPDLASLRILDVDAEGDVLVCERDETPWCFWSRPRTRLTILAANMVERKQLFEFPKGFHFDCLDLDRERGLMYSVDNNSVVKVVALTHSHSETI
jgi:hypothetical protein